MLAKRTPGAITDRICALSAARMPSNMRRNVARTSSSADERVWACASGGRTRRVKSIRTRGKRMDLAGGGGERGLVTDGRRRQKVPPRRVLGQHPSAMFSFMHPPRIWERIVTWVHDRDLDEGAPLMIVGAVIGAVAGLGIVAFYKLIDVAYALLTALPQRHVPWIGQAILQVV